MMNGAVIHEGFEHPPPLRSEIEEALLTSGRLLSITNRSKFALRDFGKKKEKEKKE